MLHNVLIVRDTLVACCVSESKGDIYNVKTKFISSKISFTVKHFNKGTKKEGFISFRR